MRITIWLLYALCNAAFSQGTSSLHTVAYQSGEYLKYTLKYGFITGGYVSFSVSDTLWNGRMAHEVVLQASTSGFVDVVFKLRDRYTSIIDTVTHQPLKSVRDIREGGYRYYNEVTYDYASVVEDSIQIHSQKSGVVQVPVYIQDILSAFYYARRFDFNDDMESGEVLSYVCYFGDEIFTLRIRYMGVEMIDTKYGQMECYLFHPVTEVGRMFKTEEDLKVWISRDDNRIPVKVKVNLKVGSFTCELDEFKGLRNPFSCIRY
jgi:hypothetical protein